MDYRLLVTYDISDDLLRAEIHKFLKNYGINSQKSVFEMIINEIEYRRIHEYLKKILREESNSVRIYELCRGCLKKTQVLGEGMSLNSLDYEVI